MSAFDGRNLDTAHPTTVAAQRQRDRTRVVHRADAGRKLWPLVCILCGVLLPALHPAAATAETRVVPSVEWLAARSTHIVVGTVERLHSEAADAPGKRQAQQLMLVRPTQILKGDVAPAAPVCISARYLDPARLGVFQQRRTKLLFFLHSSVQATSFEGQSCHLGLLGAAGDLVPIAQPEPEIFFAEHFSAPSQTQQRLEMLRAVVQCQHGIPPLDESAKPQLLPVPPQSQIVAALHAGSDVYLQVPAGRFKGAVDTPDIPQAPSPGDLAGHTVVARLLTGPDGIYACGTILYVAALVYQLESINEGPTLHGRIVADLRCPDIVLSQGKLSLRSGERHQLKLLPLRNCFRSSISKSPEPSLPRYCIDQIERAP